MSAGVSIAQTKPAIEPVDEVTMRGQLAVASPGDVIRTNVTELKSVPQLQVNVTPADRQPQFLLSDKPEYFRTGNGIAMQEYVKPGVVRLYAYHVPVPLDGPKQIVITLTNLSNQDAKLTTMRSTKIEPGGDYHKIARLGMATLLSDAKAAQPVTIPAGATVEYFRSPPIVNRDLLVHRLDEFDIDAPARLTVAQVDAGAAIDAITSLEKLPLVLPGFHPSGAGRGLFPTSVFDVTSPDATTYDTTDGPRAVVVADGTNDPWMTGTDGLHDGQPIINKGNYGAVYRVRLPVRNSDGRRLAILMSQQRTDNKWCQAAAAVVRVGERIIELPRESVRFRNVPEMAFIGEVRFEQGVGEVELQYTPPGASCLPTPIILMPF
jgi:hypothetical protein